MTTRRQFIAAVAAAAGMLTRIYTPQQAAEVRDVVPDKIQVARIITREPYGPLYPPVEAQEPGPTQPYKLWLIGPKDMSAADKRRLLGLPG